MQAIDNTGERMLSVAMEEGIITPEEYGRLCEKIGYWPHPAIARTELRRLVSEREARERRGALVVVGGGHATNVYVENACVQQKKVLPTRSTLISTICVELQQRDYADIYMEAERILGPGHLLFHRRVHPEDL